MFLQTTAVDVDQTRMPDPQLDIDSGESVHNEGVPAVFIFRGRNTPSQQPSNSRELWELLK